MTDNSDKTQLIPTPSALTAQGARGPLGPLPESPYAGNSRGSKGPIAALIVVTLVVVITAWFVLGSGDGGSSSDFAGSDDNGAVRASNSQFSLDVDGTGLPVSPVASGTAETTQLCLTWDYENLSPGAQWELVWAVNGESGPGDIASGTNQGPVDGNFWGCYTNGRDGAALLPGVLEAQWVVEGEFVFGDGIFVGPDREATSLSIENQTDEQLCSLSVIASDTDDSVIGTNRLDGPIEPGQQLDIDVARGRYDVTGFDCEGDMVLEREDLSVDGPVQIVAEP